jgi:hypothetical protein
MWGFRETGPTITECKSFEHYLQLQLTDFRYRFPFHSYLADRHDHRDYAKGFDLLWPEEFVDIPLVRPEGQGISQEYPDVERMANYKAAAIVSVKMRKRESTTKSHLGMASNCNR